MAASPLAAALLGGQGGGSAFALDPAMIQAMPNIQLGQSMISQGLSTAPASPLQALARVAQAGAGSYLQHEALGSLAKAYAHSPEDAAATLPDGHPLRNALLSNDPVIRMQGLQAYQKGLTLMSEGYNLEPGAQRKIGNATISENANPQTEAGKLQLDIERASARQAISGIESGGNYGKLGPVTRTGDRAYGKYQVMGANTGPWTEQVLGKAMTPQQFLNNPQAQDAVFDARFGQYAQKYGPQGAARAWFAGEGGMNNPNARDQLGTTVQGYANKFAAGYGNGAGVPLNVPQIANPGPPAAVPPAAPAQAPQIPLVKTPATSPPANPLQGAIDMKATQAGAEEGAKATAQANAKYYDSLHRGVVGLAAIAAHQKQNVHLLRQIVASPNFTPGAGSDAALQLQRIAAQFGINTAAAAPREIFNQVAARILADQMSGIKSMASETGEAGGRIFKPMLDIEEKANITPEDTLEGIKAKIDLLDKTGDLMMKWGDKADDYIKSNGKLDASFDKELRSDIANSRIPNIVPTETAAKAPGGATAPTQNPGARFKELMSGGMTKQQAFAKMHAEGY